MLLNSILTKLLRIYRDPSGKLSGFRKLYAISHRSPFLWEPRSKGHARLILVIAGYKDILWNIVFRRIKDQTPNDSDVCVACPGKKNKRLEEICSENNWSLLCTQENQIGLASNLAIKMHPHAKLIHKLDEDMVISTNYFSELEETYKSVEQKGENEVGFIAPTINVNGFSYRKFIEFINPDLKEKFLANFGDFRSSCLNTAAWRNPKAAKFLWEHSLPFDEVASRFLQRPQGFDVCNHRFSIGAIFLTRDTWNDSGYFSRSGEGQLGAEESDFCAYCCDSSKSMIISHRVLAGHVGFGQQSEFMIPWIIKNFV